MIVFTQYRAGRVHAPAVGHVIHSPLGRRIDTAAGGWVRAEDRADVDDAAAFFQPAIEFYLVVSCLVAAYALAPEREQMRWQSQGCYGAVIVSQLEATRLAPCESCRNPQA